MLNRLNNIIPDFISAGETQPDAGLDREVAAALSNVVDLAFFRLDASAETEQPGVSSETPGAEVIRADFRQNKPVDPTPEQRPAPAMEIELEKSRRDVANGALVAAASAEQSEIQKLAEIRRRIAIENGSFTGYDRAA